MFKDELSKVGLEPRHMLARAKAVAPIGDGPRPAAKAVPDGFAALMCSGGTFDLKRAGRNAPNEVSGQVSELRKQGLVAIHNNSRFDAGKFHFKVYGKE